MVLPYNVIPKDKEGITFAAWINPSTISPDYVRIFDFGQSSSYFDLRIRTNGWLQATLTSNSSAGEVAVSTSNIIQKNTWQHVAITATESAVLIYYNGNLMGAGSFGRSPSALYTDIVSKHMQNYIGLSRFGHDAKYFGLMDEIRIYDRALNKEEVSYLAEGHKSPIEGVEIDEYIAVNGDTTVNENTFLVNVGSKLEKHGESIIMKVKINKNDLLTEFQVKEGYLVTLVDNYDVEIKDNAEVKAGYYLKVFSPENLVITRYRLFDSSAVVLTLQQDEISNEYVLEKGSSYRLPYLIKEGQEFDGWYKGEEKLNGRIVVNESMTLIARFK